MGNGGYYNRAGRRSGGDRRFAVAAPAMSRADALASVAMMQLRALVRDTGRLPAEVIAAGREMGLLTCSDEEAELLLRQLEAELT